jgi:type IV pilus assembly protein PilN
MIRINLLQKRAAVGAGALGGGAVIDMGGGSTSDIQRKGAMHLLVLMLVPGALYALETQKIPELQSVLSSRQSYHASLAEKNNQVSASVAEIKKYKEDQAQLQRQIDTLEGLRRDRLREVRVMDSLQRSVPEKVWFNRIEIKETGLMISGFASSDLDLTIFIETISKSIFLKDVNLVRSNDFPSPTGVLKKFEIYASLDVTPLDGNMNPIPVSPKIGGGN